MRARAFPTTPEAHPCSRRTPPCPDAPDEAVFCHELSAAGRDWVAFARQHDAAILAAFAPVAGTTEAEPQREWFRLSGGQLFGQNRLGYYVGTRFIEHLAQTRTTPEIMTLVQHEPLEELFAGWLAAAGTDCRRDSRPDGIPCLPSTFS